jgi:hypothetical protein
MFFEVTTLPNSQNEGPTPEDLLITFDRTLTADQVMNTLRALADYYRACGGVGFEVNCLQALADYYRNEDSVGIEIDCELEEALAVGRSGV